MENYSFSLAANDEATNVKYKICVLCFKHRTQFIKHFQMLKHLTKCHTQRYTVIQSLSTHTTNTNIDKQLTSPLR